MVCSDYMQTSGLVMMTSGRNYAKELVRERHIAKAIRIAVFEKCHQVSTSAKHLLTLIFDGKAPKSDHSRIFRALKMKSGAIC